MGCFTQVTPYCIVTLDIKDIDILGRESLEIQGVVRRVEPTAKSESEVADTDELIGRRWSVRCSRTDLRRGFSRQFGSTIPSRRWSRLKYATNHPETVTCWTAVGVGGATLYILLQFVLDLV